MSYWDYVRRRMELDIQFVKEYWYIYAIVGLFGAYVSWRKRSWKKSR